MDDLKLYSIKKLCELLGCCYSIVTELIESGELVKVPIGGRRYGIPAWSVREWQEKYKKEASERKTENDIQKMMEVK